MTFQRPSAAGADLDRISNGLDEYHIGGRLNTGTLHPFSIKSSGSSTDGGCWGVGEKIRQAYVDSRPLIVFVPNPSHLANGCRRSVKVHQERSKWRGSKCTTSWRGEEL
jgi:hypothetical protein